MTDITFHSQALTQYWKVLMLFIIPIGGGIPGGVMLAKNYQIAWPITMFLYFVSDVLLALTFEPVLHLFVKAGRRIPALARFTLALKLSFEKVTAHYGKSTGPLALIIIAFGVDPMTGRAATLAAGHGFLTGWIIAITGDMIYFSVIMASTLWLNNIIGDNGVTTTLVILFLMMVIPGVIRKIRERRK